MGRRHPRCQTSTGAAPTGRPPSVTRRGPHTTRPILHARLAVQHRSGGGGGLAQSHRPEPDPTGPAHKQSEGPTTQGPGATYGETAANASAPHATRLSAHRRRPGDAPPRSHNAVTRSDAPSAPVTLSRRRAATAHGAWPTAALPARACAGGGHDRPVMAHTRPAASGCTSTPRCPGPASK